MTTRQKVLAGIALAIIAVTAAMSTPANAQAVKPGNCMIYAQEAAKTVKTDDRMTGETQSQIVAAFDAFAMAQEILHDASMPDVYKAMQAWGYDKAKTDAMTAEGMTAVRAGFRTPTMDKDRLYVDHLMALQSCAKGGSGKAYFGQDPDAFATAFNAAYQAIR